MKRFITFLLILSAPCLSFSQQHQPKYPSLFWEITGNGLKQPSYLFGTMHVSNKMVFHLSDSFYLAIKSVDAVALELNPDLWQGQMVEMDRMKQQYTDFAQVSGNDYLNENSFRIKKYDDELKQALSSEPFVVNSLLYRSYKSRADFEEDTFLDLYIFQTGKKSGKRATGVEDYYQTEKLIMEAYNDMAMEKKKRVIDTDGESGDDIVEKMQDAYRKGDLDLMDSLDRMVEKSDAFREKFLYKRNEIQANSIDTILKKNSLFVGVGAAHLAGERGVIELLRKKGYTLRPIAMADRDAEQKESIDKMRVPVQFSVQHADDDLYTVSTPGPLFKLTNDNLDLDRRQYSDMSNGAYYLVTRINTYGAFVGQDPQSVFKKVDSVLYENIPGKILTKKVITKNGYSGYDITNRTRRGDLQRYNIFITPYEVLVFKMSGNENYVDGKEAEQFFSSISLKPAVSGAVVFEPSHGGFKVMFPQPPFVDLKTDDEDTRWEYQANDSAGNGYLIFKKNVDNYHFLDEDSFDLSLIEESFRNPDLFEKQLSRTQGRFHGYPALDVKEAMKDGSFVWAKYIIKGPEYYVIAARGKDKKNNFSKFFNSFQFTDYRYDRPGSYVDSFMHFKVETSVKPELDIELRRLIEKATYEVPMNSSYSGYSPYWPKAHNAVFRNDSTGEEIGISVQEYPKYYFVRNPATFWKDELSGFYKQGMIVNKVDSLVSGGKVYGYTFVLSDTGSSRTLTRMFIYKDNLRYSISSMGDSSGKPSPFVEAFYHSFTPINKAPAVNIFDNRLEDFFSDLFSKDSLTHTKAQQAISNLYYGEKGVPFIMDAIGRLNISDKDYFDTKSKLIAELGYIKDSTNPVVVRDLKKIYDQVGDTTMFQNQVLSALGRHKSKEAYLLLKDLILQDPPMFNSRYEYTSLFGNLDDSLQLTRLLFPELLQLSSVDDYKDRVLSLLATLVDSGMIKGEEYADYFARIYFDARIELKKQRGQDEKQMELDIKKEGEQVRNSRYGSYGSSQLADYEVLLAPFYKKNTNVQHFFDKLLNSKDATVRMGTAIVLIKNDLPVPDSVLMNLAAKDQYRGRLYQRLEKVKRLDKFPAKYKNQMDLSRSFMVDSRENDKIDSIVFIKKQKAAYPGKSGSVYFFKYRIKKEDDWKIGFGGLQPEDENEVWSDDKLSTMTDRKIKSDEPVDDQYQKLLRRMLVTMHRSGKNFYTKDDYYSRFRKMVNYQDGDN